MYDNYRSKSRCQEPLSCHRAATIRDGSRKRFLTPLLAVAVAVTAVIVAPRAVRGQDHASQTLVRRISGASEKLELTTNTSRILTLEKNIPRVQVNNPDLLAVTPLSATQVQISAKKAGVTQVNLWDEDDNIHTVDVLIYGDARELEIALQTQFPHSSIKVYRYSESLVLKGFVDRPDHVSSIVRLAEDYSPKVINNIQVGGVQQVLLKVKIMEVSRTKLRRLGVDWAYISGNRGFAISSVSDLLSSDPDGESIRDLVVSGETFSFGIVSGRDAFFGVLDALQERGVAKTLAEPNIVAVSGRPAQFQVGGEFPILVPQSLGTSTIEFKPFGTIVDFVPIVLGNGNIRLEVRPQVSERSDPLGIELQNIRVPGLTMRKIDTAVEMKAGQTFALAGLIEERVSTRNRGFPYLSDLPYIGVPFRRTVDEVNEIELLIMVTPEFVDAMDPHQVPPGGPGLATVSPDNSQLYCHGHVEVPVHCNPIRGPWACDGHCGPGGCGPHGAYPHPHGKMYGPPHAVVTDGLSMPGGLGYDGLEQAPPDAEPLPPVPDDLTLPDEARPNGAQRLPRERSAGDSAASAGQYSPPRQPVFLRNAVKRDNPQGTTSSAATGGLIGPIGYDAE